MANFFGVFVTLVTVWAVFNKPGEVQGQLFSCSSSEQQLCGNTPFIPTGELPCFRNRTMLNNFICNCGTVPNVPLFDNFGIDINIGRLCSTSVPQTIAFTSLQTCYGCPQNYFTSINYGPNSVYPNNRGDVYLLYIPGAREISFEFSPPFSVETKKDDLFVGAGLEFSSAAVGLRTTRGEVYPNSLYYFDNTTIAFGLGTPRPFTITGDSAWVYFRTDRNYVNVGFNLTWSVDRTPPDVRNCPTDIRRNLVLGNTVSVTWPPIIATDNSGGPVEESCTHQSGNQFPLGLTTVMCNYTDLSGNIRRCNFRVLVLTAPQLDCCPADISRTVPPGQSSLVVTYSLACNTAVLGITLVDSTHQSGDSFSVGRTTVTLTFQDSDNFQASCSFQINIDNGDPDPPVPSCPKDIFRGVPPGTREIVVPFREPFAVDEVDGPATVISRSHVPGQAFPVGTTRVTYVFSDRSNNVASCSFQVIIFIEDNIPPVVQCGPDITETIPLFTGGLRINFPECTATDDSGSVILVSRTRNPGEFFRIGSVIVTYTFTDSSGNRGVGSFRITVVEEDNIPPVVQCGPDITETIPLFTRGLRINFPACTATDDSGSAILVSRTHNPGDFFTTGSVIVTYTFTDSSGNRGLGSFRITVVEEDNIPPVVQCGPDITETIPLFTGGLRINFPECTATDDSGSVILVSRTRNPGDFFTIGSVIVTYTFTDSSGNQGVDSFRITVVEGDTDPPMLRCPGNIVVTVFSGVNSITIKWSLPEVSDVSEPVRLVNASHNPGDEFPVGTTTVRYEYADACDNKASCTFDIRIMTESPCVVNPCNNGGTCVAVDLDTISCVCPSCFTGDFCQTAVDVCSGNMCTSGSTCVPVPGSCEQYTCNCPPCFTGPFCIFAGDVCAGNQCSNGGVCQIDPTDCTSYTCICPACFSGPFCQFRANGCSPNPCQNNALCTDLSATECNAYRCDCVGCYEGVNCERETNACLPNPCRNNAVCTDLSAIGCNTYRCDCVGCFDGFNCEIAIPNPCNQNPCLNGGTCTRNLQFCASYTCRCSPGFDGDNCQDRSITLFNPCNSFPCENGGSCCNKESDTNYVCVCPPGYAGINCGLIAAPGADSCFSNPCQNGGSCFASYCSGSSSFIYTPQYMCLCTAGFTGNNCQFNVFAVPSQNICSMEPGVCQNGGICTNTFNSFTRDVDFKCTDCREFAIGKTCEVIVPDACISSPCINSGTCVSVSGGFICICDSAFQGTFCQIPGSDFQPPEISGCPENFSQLGPSRVFFTPPRATDNSGYVRLLFLSHTPGQVFPIGTTAVSYIFGDAAGNQNQCTFYVTITDDGLPFYKVILNCPGNIEAKTSGSSANVMFGTPDAMSRDGGVFLVSQSHTSGSSFPVGTTPVSFVFRDAAGNQAECQFNVTVTTDVCFRECNLPFSPVCGSDGVTYGNLCESEVARCRDPSLTFTQGACINDPCSSSPCLGGGTCFRTGTGSGLLCLCTLGRSGDRCEIDTTPCDPNPCQGGGTCIELTDTSVCICLPGRSGPRCENTVVVNPCDPNPCLGGGTCFPLSDTTVVCACLPGRTGQRCENTVVVNPCDPNPCLGGGTCFPLSDTTVVCACLPGRTGQRCENTVVVNPCDPNPCLGGGTCFPLSDNTVVCACLPGRTGQRCENTFVVNPCDPNPCLGGGTCFSLSDTTAVCACLPGRTGQRCENSINQGSLVDSSLCQDRTLTLPQTNTFVEVSIIVPNATFNGMIVPPTSFGGTATSLTTATYFLGAGSSRFIYNYEFIDGSTATCDFTILVLTRSQVGKRSVDDTEMFAELSLCDPNPCLNEGQCHLLFNEDDATLLPYCECVEGWTGPTCSTSVSFVSHFHETVEMWTLLVILVVVMLTFALMVCQYQRRCFQGRKYQDEKALIQ